MPLQSFDFAIIAKLDEIFNATGDSFIEKYLGTFTEPLNQIEFLIVFRVLFTYLVQIGHITRIDNTHLYEYRPHQ